MPEGISALITGSIAILLAIVKKGGKPVMIIRGVAGSGFFILGAAGIVRSYIHLSWLVQQPVWWIVFLSIAFLEGFTGFIFVFELMRTAASGSEGKSGEFVFYQILFGSFCSAIGLFAIVYRLFFYR